MMLGQGSLGQLTIGQPEDLGTPQVLPVIGVAKFAVCPTADPCFSAEPPLSVVWITAGVDLDVDICLAAESDVDLHILRGP